MTAYQIIVEAVERVLESHASRSPWRRCSCGWKAPHQTLASHVIKGLYNRHVAEVVTEQLLVSPSRRLPALHGHEEAGHYK
jgi:hypothetical protein